MKLTKEDIDKVRNIEGFPIAKDEDIIALSNPPYYTACPNPFIEEFIKKNSKPYDEVTDNYYCEPFAADVSEGKTDPIYMAHTYHTKVPHKAIMRYILHYTKPNDIVLDGFCGTGMTALAAQMCETPDLDFKHDIEQNDSNIQWGARKAIISDLSPIATFIASNYNQPIKVDVFKSEINTLLNECEKEFAWMYKTRHIGEDSNSLIAGNGQGVINYIVWSDIFICPHCGKELIFWDIAVDDKKNVHSSFSCSECGMILKKSDCTRSVELSIDNKTNTTIKQAKQVPVLINYAYQGKKYEKRPDDNDLEVIEQVNKLLPKFHIPTDKLPEGDNTAQPIRSHGFMHVNQFYYNRSAIIFSYVMEKSEQFSFGSTIRFLVTSILTKTGSKLHNIGFKDGKLNLAGAMPNVLYVPSTIAERNIIELLRSKIKGICKIYSYKNNNENLCIQCCSATDMRLMPNSIDYIFTDPPFGSNINYSELNFLWESWLKVKTNNITEAIVNKVQNKALPEYQELMTKCFIEYYRALKPGRWMTVEFHNSLNAVWNAIQEAIQRAGFIIADVRILDKKQGTFKQMTTSAAVKQDLVISAYKPKERFTQEFIARAGSEETVWEFVKQHLEKLPVVVRKRDKIELVVERQSFLLFDRMVAYHIMNGINVPIDASDFYKGLDEKFLKRDSMYFLHDQVNEYDTARIETDVEPIQFSLIVSDEKTAIAWLYQQLTNPQTYSEIQPKFMQEIRSIEKYEKLPELSVLLDDNFLQNDEGKWYIPDVTKAADVAKLREKRLLKDFEEYLNSTGKLKLFRTEAIRVGFAKLWKNKNYAVIVKTAERLPEKVIQEDDKLLMYYDISLSRME
ncbi:site-specific DNA-methyltransferase [Clostridium sp. P21]|uniref:Site-specific DNA-methyltransferase n=1 Tax=Clostridium muellerianum TaxID=2716538 RepID=A0A7Y0EH91_9CLOT|nr:DNA methyltransferase [Clostridium muellerianum]NMM63087.1 site-specific DNA-methyltransferase [Clostridium muellerianum]